MTAAEQLGLSDSELCAALSALAQKSLSNAGWADLALFDTPVPREMWAA